MKSMLQTGVDAAGCCHRITATIGGEVVVEPPSVVGIAMLLADVDKIIDLEHKLPHTETR
jgi:hypothetical protein